MPHAVTHVLLPIILLALFRDIFYKGNKKEKFPLHYVLIGGIFGLLPDIDVVVYYALSFFGFTLNEVHRVFSHNIFLVLLFLALGFIFFKSKNSELGRHHLKLSTIFFVISFGVFIHLLLDILVSGDVRIFYPLSSYSIALNLLNYLPLAWRNSFLPFMDAIILVLWLIYMELKHKVSDFI